MRSKTKNQLKNETDEVKNETDKKSRSSFPGDRLFFLIFVRSGLFFRIRRVFVIDRISG